MRLVRQVAALAGAVILAAMAIGSPARAGTTEIRDVATGSLYSGNIRFTNLGNLTIVTSLASGVCGTATMQGSIASDGTALSIGSATFSCTYGGGSVTVTAQSLPWTGGNITYAPVPSGRDGTITMAGFSVKAVLYGGLASCTYAGSLTTDVYNTSGGTMQMRLSSAAVSGSGLLCPAIASVSGTLAIAGETSPGSGVFTNSLYLTGT